MKPSRGREPLADRVKRNAAGLAMYASAAPADKSRAPIFAPEPEKPARAPRKPNARPEGDAQDAVIAWLLANPRVFGLKRINRGLAVEGNRRVPYCHVYGKHEGEYMTALDLEFWVMDGQGLSGPMFPCEIEMKAPGFKAPNMNDKTQRAQFYRIEYVREHGGIAGFCTSVADVEKLLA